MIMLNYFFFQILTKMLIDFDILNGLLDIILVYGRFTVIKTQLYAIYRIIAKELLEVIKSVMTMILYSKYI